MTTRKREKEEDDFGFSWPTYNEKQLVDFDKEMAGFDYNEKTFLKNVVLQDRKGRTIRGLITAKGAIRIGTMADGYQENDDGSIKSLGDQPYAKMMDKINQWRKWRDRQSFRKKMEDKEFEKMAEQSALI